jgi:signal transduction protein with GAF and PtsI domain
MEDDYMKERAADIKDISERLIRTLGEEKTEFKLTEPAVIARRIWHQVRRYSLTEAKYFLSSRRGLCEFSHCDLARTMNILPSLELGNA